MKVEKVELQKLHSAQVDIAKAFQQYKKVVIRCGRRFGKTSLLERCAAKWAYNGEKVGWLGPKYKLNAPTYGNLIHSVEVQDRPADPAKERWPRRVLDA